MMNQSPRSAPKLSHNPRGLAETIALSGGLLSSGLLIAGLFGRAPMPLLAGVFGLGASATGGVMGSQLEQLRSSKRRQLAEMEQERDRLKAELASMLDAQVQMRQKLAPYEAGDAASLLALPPVAEALGKVQSQAQSWQEQYVICDRKVKEITTHLLDRNAQLEACQQSAEAMEARLTEQLEETEAQLNARLAEAETELQENHEDYLKLQREYNQLTASYKELSIHHAAFQAQFEDKVKLRFHESSSELIREEINKAIAQKQLELQQSQAAIDALRQEINESADLLSDVKDNALPIIRQKFDGEISARDSMLMQLSGQLEQCKKQVEQLLAPRQFRGETAIDRIGNRIIAHFAQYGIVLDALDSASTPAGFRLRFKVDRNAETVRLSEEEFDRRTSEAGLMGLSHAPLDFVLDARNFILSVDLVTALPSQAAVPQASVLQQAIAKGEPVTAIVAAESVASGASSDDAFRALGCFPASEFEAIVRDKFVPRVRVVAGSTGGKSPLMELIAVALAKLHQAELWLLNPLPGSEKDWFSVPGLVQGSDPIKQQIYWLEKAYQELIDRRQDLSENHQFLIVIVDELSDLARHYGGLGRVLKSFYQVSDHAQMGIVTAAQGANVSGVSGSAKKDNADKLMEEDFQNATQVFTSQAAATWVKKNRRDLEPALKQLQKLCDELNQAEGLSSRPKSGTKVVDRAAYRIALVVSPAADEPFFIQLPPYSFYAGKLEGIRFPTGTQITARRDRQMALGLLSDLTKCPECGSTRTEINKTQKASIKRVCKDCRHYYNVPKTTG